MTHRRRAGGVALLLAAVLAAPACSSADDATADDASPGASSATGNGDAGDDTISPVTTPAGTTPDDEPAGTSPWSDAEPPPAPTSGLGSRLLDTPDLPAEFVPTGRDDEASPLAFCGISLTADFEPVESASVSFSHTAASLFLSEYAVRFADDAAADAALATVRTGIDGCERWVQSGADGARVEYSIGPLDVEVTGDDTEDEVAFAATTTFESLGELETHAAVTRVGDVVVWTSLAGVVDGGLAPEDLERYAGAAVARLDAT